MLAINKEQANHAWGGGGIPKVSWCLNLRAGIREAEHSLIPAG